MPRLTGEPLSMSDTLEPRNPAYFLDDVLLLPHSETKSRDDAIDAILLKLADGSRLDAELVPALRAAILARDDLGPTGIGEGVAIPHAWHISLGRIVSALAVSPSGLDYPSLDGLPVHIVLLILSPPSKEFEPAKQAIFSSWLGRLRDPAFRARLIRSKTADELRRAIQAGVGEDS